MVQSLPLPTCLIRNSLHFYAAPQISLETKPFIAKTMIAEQRMKQKSGFFKRVDKG